MKLYELTYLISPDLSEEELKIFSEKINNFIQEEAGTLEKTTEPFKIKLSSPIKKKGEGFSNTLNFSLNSEKLKNLEKKLKSENQILRYIILTKKTIKKIPTKKVLPPSAGQPRPTAGQPKVEKVELEEIDKKIEEILGE